MRRACSLARSSAILLGFFAGFLVLAPWASHAQAAKPAGSLNVLVIAPPKGAKAKVNVRGPGGQSWNLSKTKTLRGLRLGTYTIAAGKVTGRTWSSSPSLSSRKVKLSAKSKTGRVEISYWNVISKKTEVVSTKSIAAFQAPLDGVGRLSSPARFAVGEIVSGPVSDKTPAGMLVKVTKVLKRGKINDYQVVQARLDEAVPRGQFRAIAPKLTASFARKRSAKAKASSRMAGTCSTSATATLDATGRIGLTPDFSGKWDGLDSSVTLRLRPEAVASIDAVISAEGKCEIPETQILSKNLGKFFIVIPGIPPIPVFVDLDILGGAEATVGGRVRAYASVTAGAEIGATATRNSFTPIGEGPYFEKDAGIEVTTKSTANVWIKGRLTAKVFDAAGPYVAIKMGPEATADPSANPWLTINGAIAADVGIRGEFCKIFLCVRFDQGGRVLSTSIPLYSAGRGFQPGDTGGNIGSGPPGGDDPVDQDPQLDPSQATSVGVGGFHNCAVMVTGRVRCWGKGDDGQLGNRKYRDSPYPVAVSGIDDAVQVSAGTDSTCAVLASGRVRCWGSGANGLLGNGSTGRSATPVEVSGITNATTVSVGDGHACALLGATIACWGLGTNGRLGNGGQTSSLVPVSVSGISTATSVSAGSTHTCATLANGTAWCWGNNAAGQLGNGSTTNASSPVQVTGISGASMVKASKVHLDAQGSYPETLGSSCVLIAPGSVKCWGQGYAGQLGNGATSGSLVPVSVLGIAAATELDVGNWNACVRSSSGQTSCWGFRFGSSPVEGELNGALGIGVGVSYRCGMVAAGAIKCWGSAPYGELGDGSRTPQSSSTPVLVQGIG